MSEDQTNPETTDVVAAAITDGAYTLFVADFADTDTAWEAYEALKSLEEADRASSNDLRKASETLDADAFAAFRHEEDRAARRARPGKRG